MKPALLIILSIFPIFGYTQEDKPCIIPDRPKYSTGPNPKTVPVFPGCETFKNNNDSLNLCTRNFIGNQIAQKLEMEFFPDAKIDSTLSDNKFYVTLDVDVKGKLKLNLKNKKDNPFEDYLQNKLNQIAEEQTGITPAISENGYCVNYKYALPVIFYLEN